MNRTEKIQWLRDTCTKDFVHNQLLDEMVMWMGEDDFSKFYDHLCGCWDLARSPEDPDGPDYCA